MFNEIKKVEKRFVLPDLSEMEYVLFLRACDHAITNGYTLMNLADIQRKYNHHFLSGQEIHNYFESMNRKGYITRKIKITNSGTREYYFSITHHGFSFYLQVKMIDINVPVNNKIMSGVLYE